MGKKFNTVLCSTIIATSVMPVTNVHAEDIVDVNITHKGWGNVRATYIEAENKVVITGTDIMSPRHFREKVLDKIDTDLEVLEIRDKVKLYEDATLLFSHDRLKHAKFKFNPEIDTSQVTNMSEMFLGCEEANPDVSRWDVSKVKNMKGMFKKAKKANPDVSKWDVSKVTDMSYMFENAEEAIPEVGNWNVAEVRNFSHAFDGAKKANPDVSKWDISKATNISFIFANTEETIPEVGDWKTSNITNMRGVFNSAKKANPDVSNWDVSKVTDMSYMFYEAEEAIPDVSKWITSNVTNLSNTFNGAIKANPDVSKWDVSKVETFESMFRHTEKAHPDISKWDVSSASEMNYIFEEALKAMPLTLPDSIDISKIEDVMSLYNVRGKGTVFNMTADKKVLQKELSCYFDEDFYAFYDEEGNPINKSMFYGKYLSVEEEPIFLDYKKSMIDSFDEGKYTVKPIEVKGELMEIKEDEEVSIEEIKKHIKNFPESAVIVKEDGKDYIRKDTYFEVKVKFVETNRNNGVIQVPYKVISEKYDAGEPEKIVLNKGDEVPEDIYANHIKDLPEGSKVKPKTPITTDEVKTGEVEVTITFPDGTTKDEKIPYEIKKKPGKGGGGGSSSGGGSSYNNGGGSSNSGTETIIGSDRYETSIRASRNVKSDILVIAHGESYADALSSQNIVNRYKCKFILVHEGSDVDRIVRETNPKKVYIVGGKDTIPEDMYYAFRKHVKETYRVSGADRYLTNEYTLRVGNYDKFSMADGRNFPDALSSTPLNRYKNLGLILVDGSKKPYTAKREIVYTFGGENSVKFGFGKRLGGVDRYATNDLINKELKAYRNAIVVDGTRFPDALSAQNLLLKDKTEIVLGNPKLEKGLTQKQLEELRKRHKVFILGGSLGIKDIK